MNLEIHTRGVEMNESLAQLIERRMLSALGRFGSRVRHVRVQLTDLNGPRGGIDTRCKIEASLDMPGSIVIHETHETPFAAVAHASETVSRAVRRRIKRLGSKRRARRQSPDKGWSAA
ncbi:Sigma 54 modulation protein / S30EA ribosomal protein [Planctomycetes bacterium Poly30]|uniref:Sigma 54 modulation protein / S30EA ribosomal protein n=1 Tax=Saltatorellus ferox TaxID=2528018 RepID=A0A518EYM7_9BACT|nr:Sigma 54 modulation protein / S30EA ribosomal protein [Planctomycetes bacterium Poly30]